MANGSQHLINGKSPWQRVGLETAGFIPAELVSMGVSLGVVAVADTIAPGVIKDASHALSKAVFEPYLDYIEGALGKVCKLEECQVNENESREVRAERLAKTTLVFAAAWVASMIAKMETRRFLNNSMGVAEEAVAGKKWWQFWKMTNHEKIIMGLDEGVHYGSLLLMNTSAAGATDEMIRASKNVLVKCGVPERKAHEIASMAVIWELPNALGLAAGIGGITGIHTRQWDKKLGDWLAKKPTSHVAALMRQEEMAGLLQNQKS